MAEAVSSQVRLCSTTDAERRQQLDDFELLIEGLIKRSTQQERELREANAKIKKLETEIERLKGE